MDKIFIQQLRVEAKVGIYPREKLLPQTIELDLEVGLPHKGPYVNDKIAETIDYDALIKHIHTTLDQQHFGLIERLAEHLAQTVLDKFAAPYIKVSICKLGVSAKAKRVGVVLERTRR